MIAEGLILGEDGVVTCAWHGGLADYRHYHDHEWGHPVTDDTRLFEKICLEGFQSGLSWLTILRKRDAFRAGFAGFDIPTVAAFGEADVARLLADAGIVRHRGKIVSTINNARGRWRCRPSSARSPPISGPTKPRPEERPAVIDRAHIRANPTTAVSTRISKDLKKRGWTFVGPTTVYAFMQAMGWSMTTSKAAPCAPLWSRKGLR